MKINSEFQPPTQNSYGDIDDILMWFTHRYNLTIVVDYKGEPVRIVEFPNGAILNIDIPKTYQIRSYLKINGISWVMESSSRSEFLKHLKEILDRDTKAI